MIGYKITNSRYKSLFAGGNSWFCDAIKILDFQEGPGWTDSFGDNVLHPTSRYLSM